MSFTLADLEKRIDERSRATAEQSYTRSLIEKGPAHCAKKMGEEAFETAIAAPMLAIHERVTPTKLTLDIFCSFTLPKDGVSAGHDKGRARQGSHA